MRTSRLATLAVLGLTAVAVTACGSETPASEAQGSDQAADSCGPLEEMTTVSLGVNPGTQDLVTSRLVDEGFAEKYNLDLEVRDFQNPPASAAAVIAGAVDIGFGGNTTMAVARSQGADVFFFGMLAAVGNQVFVREDSDIQELADLEGRNVGSFSGTNSATFSILAVIAAETAGIDNLLEAAEVVVAPDAALAGLLDNGNIDAMLAGSTGTVDALLSGKYRSIVDLSTAYRDATGEVPTHIGPVSTESYAEGHCSELVAFSNALRDSVEFVQSNDQVWTDYAAATELDSPEAPATLKEVLGGSFVSEWNEEQLQASQGLLESFIPVLGNQDFVTEIPEGLFSLDYAATSEGAGR